MINILSVSCSIAFAPYLIDAMSASQSGRTQPSRSVRQGGGGLVIECGERIRLGHRNRWAELDVSAIRHYLATVGLRAKSYQASLLPEEVVVASVNASLLISHPQSEIWLERDAVEQLIIAYRTGTVSAHTALPEWLVCSLAAGRLLLSDQRTARWLLLAADHIAEFERRLSLLGPLSEASTPSPPLISIKGVSIHLQSAFRLARALRAFADTRTVREYEEVAPEFRVSVARAVDGFQLADTNTRVAITAREAPKWADIIAAELTHLNAAEIVRDKITTVTADAPGGRFVLQWGDEVFLPDGSWRHTGGSGGRLVQESVGGFTVLLDRARDACVALTPQEISMLGG